MTKIELDDTGEFVISHKVFGDILHITVTEYTKVLHEPERVVTDHVELAVYDAREGVLLLGEVVHD